MSINTSWRDIDMTKFIDAQALLSALYDQLDPASATLDHLFDTGTGEHVVRLEIRSGDVEADSSLPFDRVVRKKASLLRHLIATT
jgi:hypothetical protein